jgi:hypothetical protein
MPPSQVAELTIKVPSAGSGIGDRDDDEWGWVLMVGVDESDTTTLPPLCNAGHGYPY